MTKKKKVFLIIFTIIAVLIIAGIVIATKSSKKVEYITQAVERITLKQSVDATGKIESAEKIDLNFKTTGRINKINIKVGDKVKTNQILANLEAGALSSSVDNARAQVNQAMADYDKLLAGASSQDINISQYTASQKQQDLNAA